MAENNEESKVSGFLKSSEEAVAKFHYYFNDQIIITKKNVTFNLSRNKRKYRF